jgi:uncharacterized membrane protein
MLFIVSGYFDHSKFFAILSGTLIGIASQSGLVLLAIFENRSFLWKSVSGLLILPYAAATGYYLVGSIFYAQMSSALIAGAGFVYYSYAFLKWRQIKTEARR